VSAAPFHIRDARPDDEAAIRRLSEALSRRSVYQRFLSCSPLNAQPYAHSLFDADRRLNAVVASRHDELLRAGPCTTCFGI
jgi:hypothetical protein